MSVGQNLSIAAILLHKTNLVLEGLKGTKEEVEKPEAVKGFQLEVGPQRGP